MCFLYNFTSISLAKTAIDFSPFPVYDGLKPSYFHRKVVIWMYTTKANLSRSLRLASAITAAGILLLANLRFPYTFSFFFEDITGFLLVFIFFFIACFCTAQLYEVCKKHFRQLFF